MTACIEKCGCPLGNCLCHRRGEGVKEDFTKAEYTGNASDTQVRWGSNDDPRGLLEPGKVYEVKRVDVHTWHTKVFLTDFPGKKFNSVHFKLS